MPLPHPSLSESDVGLDSCSEFSFDWLKSESEPSADRCNERRYCAAAVARLSVGCYPDVGLQHIELGRGVRGQSCYVTLILLINNMLTILVFSRVHCLLRCVI